MRPVSEFHAQNIKVLFTDIDDTLTQDGRLGPEAYTALWDLFAAGVQVVPVTGRPAGWCELIARQWPVSGVVGENGGFYFRYHEKKMRRHFAIAESDRERNRQRLNSIRDKVLQSVPGAAVASDQFCRLLDLAIDFCEDVAPLSPEQVDQIVAIFEKNGATAKVSSIHVNGWYGDYDKLSMCKIFAQKELGFKLGEKQQQMVFVGDSPNDEPMFAYFENSIAVANINDFLDKIKTLPHSRHHCLGGKVSRRSFQ